jgi:hypothetical protein
MNGKEVILHLLKEGEWNQAILLYREETGVPRRQAIREVQHLAHLHHLNPATPWLWKRTTKTSTSSTDSKSI